MAAGFDLDAGPSFATVRLWTRQWNMALLHLMGLSPPARPPQVLATAS